MFYYQCAITKYLQQQQQQKSQNSNLIKKLIIYDTPYIIGLRTLSHTPQRQARTVLKTSTDNHFSSCHSHQLLRSSKTRHYQHLAVDVLR